MKIKSTTTTIFLFLFFDSIIKLKFGKRNAAKEEFYVAEKTMKASDDDVNNIAISE